MVEPCTDCHGTGREASTRQVKVRLPAGVEDGQRIRVKGRGSPGQRGAPPGDLFVLVHVVHDPRFSRRGRNITTSATITYPQAAFGTQVTVETIEEPVTLKVPAGTQPGTMLRVKGRGVSASTGKTAKAAGDLLVKIDVVVPKKLNDEQRSALEAYAKTFEPSVEEVTS